MELAFLLKAGLLKEEEENVYVADSRLKKLLPPGKKRSGDADEDAGGQRFDIGGCFLILSPCRTPLHKGVDLRCP